MKLKWLTVCAILMFTKSWAQNLAEGIKMLNYERNKSAKTLFSKLYSQSATDPKIVYWYGQALIENDEVQQAKELYQKALQSGLNDPLLWVGMGHTEILLLGDANAAKQRFEAALTNAIEKKGKLKGKPSTEILLAVARANASFTNSTFKLGDPVYCIDKATQAAEQDPTNAEALVLKGLGFLKMGNENGGSAVIAFTEASQRDPKNVIPPYRIGKIYFSQNNKEQFEKYFTDVVNIDPTFSPVYLTWFNYYADKDVAKAKEYLDKFIANADPDPANDYYLADYLFRAGKYNESIAKGKEIEAKTSIQAMPRLNVLYAYNYDRLGDSLQAKKCIETFFQQVDASKIQVTDYELAAKVLGKISGSEAALASIIENALKADTSKTNKVNYINLVASNFQKSKQYAEQYKWLLKLASLKEKLSELEYYNITAAALNSKDYTATIDLSKKYFSSYPDKPQPLTFLRKAAIASDVDSSKGLAIEHLNFINTQLEKDTAKNKKSIFNNLYYMLIYYGDKVKDYTQALTILDKMIALYPNPGEENKFAIDQKELIKKVMNKPAVTPKSKPKA